MPNMATEDPTWNEPINIFESLLDDEVIDLLITETNRYATQKNLPLDVTAEEMKTFLGILILSGYVQVPRRSMYWEKTEDAHSPFVAGSMRRDRFTKIMNMLHVADNEDLPAGDKYGKVRPLIEILNNRFQQFAMDSEGYSIDESMIPYFGKHGCKMFIRGKPIRWGFKVWCGTTKEGYLLWFSPYQGKDTGFDDPSLGLGASVVLKFADVLETIGKENAKLFFDNFFTGIPLLEELKKRGHEGTGTIRTNRTEQCPLPSTKEMKKKERGTYTFKSDSNVVVCSWNDNSVVTIASNSVPVEPTTTCLRWSSQQKEVIQVQKPLLVHEYNKNMGGVDRMDQNISLYRTSIRGKKWYIPIIFYCIDAAVQNAWQLSRLASVPLKMDMLTFRRSVATSLIRKNGVPSQQGSKGRPAKPGPSDPRYDEVGHFVCSQDRQTKCGHCHTKTTTRCIKCDRGIHVRCFINYHTR